jgi:transcriptional regulator with XRE-family HTH domain
MHGPTTIRRAYIGRELKRQRDDQGMLLDTAGHRVDRSPSSLSQIETGRTGLRVRDLKYILDVYGIPDGPYKDGLVEVCRQDREIRRGGFWWEKYEDVVSASARDYASVEYYAHSIDTYSPQYIPGALQTREFASLAVRWSLSDADLPNADRLVDFRLDRQQVLYRRDPAAYHAVLDEAVVRRVRGGPSVMGPQLDRLLADSEKPNIILQVLPFSCAEDPGVIETCSLVEIGCPDSMRVALVDTLTRALAIHDRQEYARYREQFDRLAGLALSEQASRDLIRRIRLDL